MRQREADISARVSESLLKFRKAYDSVNVTVNEGYMIYRTVKGFADEATARANNLITHLDLPLIAVASSFKDSFIIKSKSLPWES